MTRGLSFETNLLTPPCSQKWTLVLSVIDLKGDVIFGILEFWLLTYIAATDAHVGDADDHVVGIFSIWNWSVFESGIARSVEEA